MGTWADSLGLMLSARSAEGEFVMIKLKILKVGGLKLGIRVSEQSPVSQFFVVVFKNLLLGFCVGRLEDLGRICSRCW